MPSQELQDEILSVIKVRPKPEDTDESFTREILKRANKISDAAWDNLSNPAQKWINEAMEASNDDRLKDLLVVPEPAKVEDRPTEEPSAAPEQAETTEQVEDKVAKKRKATAKARPRKAKAAAKKANGASRGRRGSYDPGAKITLLAKENPKRKGTKAFKRFEKYRPGMTVQEALDAGVSWADLRWDNGHRLIRVG